MQAPRIPAKNLVLIGGRGCGKSALARRIARRNKNFHLFPLDPLICCEAEGATIPQIVAAHGWAHFRELEYRVVRRIGSYPAGGLIDCGGGVVVDLDAAGEEVFSERKVAALREHGHVVYLQRDVEYLLRQIQGDRNRPDLSADRSFAEIMARRDPWYRRAAHVVVSCGELSKKELIREILRDFPWA